MKNNLLQEIIVAAILVALAVLLVNPTGLWMPSTVQMMMVAGLVILFAVFASFMMSERAQDEREQLHRMLADRIAFLVGAGILVVAIGVQSFKHDINLWLILALSGMILAKIIGLRKRKCAIATTVAINVANFRSCCCGAFVSSCIGSEFATSCFEQRVK